MRPDVIAWLTDQRASLSTDGLYRWHLARIWEETKPLAFYLMINPSTADAENDDATIRSLGRLSRFHGFGGFVVGNLFALRTPNPDDVRNCAAVDPAGALNDGTLKYLAAIADTIVFAWGSSLSDWPTFRDRRAYVVKTLKEAAPQHRPQCFGLNKDGEPKHPLYLPSNMPLRDYYEELEQAEIKVELSV